MSNVQVTEINGMKIYNLTGGKSWYDLMKESHFSVKKLKKNEEYMNHIEILQDCVFPVSCECIRISKDGNYVYASGIYPPRLKLFDLNEMSLKCERGFDSQIRKIEIISDDYKKCAMLCDDRSIEIHAQYGKHFKIRIPKYGRDLKYDRIYCDLFSCGTGNEIFRLNWHQGQFLQSFETKAQGVNALGINEPMEWLGSGCENGIVEWFDLRMKNKVYSFDDWGADITALSFSNDGLQMGIGNVEGNVKVFDIRNPKPVYTVNHAYKFPIKKIVFDDHSQNIITVDKKIAKFSNIKNGKAFTNIEPKHEINDFEWYPKSGMFFFGNESEKVDIYFVPQLGPAPKWACFLDNITEELEEAKTYSWYEDYKFWTVKELEQIGAKDLIGTKMVKAYMHGYFMDWKWYKKLKQLTEPFSYDKYWEDKKEAKLNKYFGERIVFNKGKQPKVNKKLLTATVEGEAGNVWNIKDKRFEKMFNDKNYEIDFSSDKFKKKNRDVTFNDTEIVDADIKFWDDDDADNSNDKDKPNKKGKKNTNGDEDLIVSKEIMRWNEKLLAKKREKVEKFYSGYEKEDDRLDFSKRLMLKENKENDEDSANDEFDIVNKIRKLENIKNKTLNKKKAVEKDKDLTKGKRIVGGIDKLTRHKLK